LGTPAAFADNSKGKFHFPGKPNGERGEYEGLRHKGKSVKKSDVVQKRTREKRCYITKRGNVLGEFLKSPEEGGVKPQAARTKKRWWGGEREET